MAGDEAGDVQIWVLGKDVASCTCKCMRVTAPRVCTDQSVNGGCCANRFALLSILKHQADEDKAVLNSMHPPLPSAV